MARAISVALATLAVGVGAAPPATAGDRPHAYCTAVERALGLVGASESPDDFEDIFGGTARSFRRAAKVAPEGIRTQVKKVSRFYTRLAKLDLEELGELEKLTADLGEAYEKVLTDTIDRCGTVPPPIATVPTTEPPLR